MSTALNHEGSVMKSIPTSVVDINESEFKTAVLERSRSVPVVVDFWAPWCGPCRILSPILERLVTGMNGAFVLAKINVDQNQRLAARYGVQGIPAVKAFRDGSVVAEFTGALPEREVRAWLKRLVPSPADQLAAEASALERSNPEVATARYREALRFEPAHSPSLLGLGRVLALKGDPEAVDVLRQVKPDASEYPMAQALLDLADFLAAADESAPVQRSTDEAAAQQWQTAASFARQGQWEDALERLFWIVQYDRTWGDGAARRAMLAIFALLGDRDPLVIRYRQRLASVLFG
jgi:putative thioredoxin